MRRIYALIIVALLLAALLPAASAAQAPADDPCAGGFPGAGQSYEPILAPGICARTTAVTDAGITYVWIEVCRRQQPWAGRLYLLWRTYPGQRLVGPISGYPFWDIDLTYKRPCREISFAIPARKGAPDVAYTPQGWGYMPIVGTP